MNTNSTTGNSAPRVLIAMSGGVDSSVAAFLLQQQGYDCTAAMMKLFDAGEDEYSGGSAVPSNRGCCTLEDADDARAVAARLGIPFHIFNFTREFDKLVMSRFARAYQNGITPNPCIDCNRFVKFEKFLHRAEELEHDFIATGHYARIEKKGGRFLLKKGLDESKDQSYVLYAMTQRQLARTLFPLGGMDKKAVREVAVAAGFINAKKRDSQDICFAPDGDYAGFIRKYNIYTASLTTSAPGHFISHDGKVLGTHRGLIHYTVGQRKGLGISAPHPLYVCALNPHDNTVVLGESERLFSPALTARDINLIPFDTLPAPLRITAKIRYSHPPQPAVLRQTGYDELQLTFDKPERAITPGQAVVFYDDDVVIGGGTIS